MNKYETEEWKEFEEWTKHNGVDEMMALIAKNKKNKQIKKDASKNKAKIRRRLDNI